MQSLLNSPILFIFAAQVFHAAAPSSSASVGGNDAIPQTTTVSPPIVDSSLNVTLSASIFQFNRENGTHVYITGFEDGSRMISVDYGQLIITIGPARNITHISSEIQSDFSYVGRTLAEFYPDLQSYFDTSNPTLEPNTWNLPKESKQVMKLLEELDSLQTEPTIDEALKLAEVEGHDNDDNDDDNEPANECPICKNLISGSDSLVLNCQHEFHIRCIWDWR